MTKEIETDNRRENEENMKIRRHEGLKWRQLMKNAPHQ